MSERTVYAVATGEYEQYGINVLFTTRELAEAHAKRINGDVEEYELLDREPIPTEYHRLSTCIDEDGTEWVPMTLLSRRGGALAHYGPEKRGHEHMHFSSWDYAVPYPSAVRVAPWEGNRSAWPVHIEVVGRRYAVRPAFDEAVAKVRASSEKAPK